MEASQRGATKLLNARAPHSQIGICVRRPLELCIVICRQWPHHKESGFVCPVP